MKTKIIAILLIICTLVMCISSCNQMSDDNNEDLPIQTSQSIEDDDLDQPTNSQSSSDDQSPENNEATNSLALEFYDYSDFLLFGTTGKLDPNKYVNAELLAENYKLPSESFFDFKKMLDLPELSDGWKEEIIIQKSNEFAYYVYSTDKSGNLQTEYSVFVKIKDPPAEERKYAASIIPITQIADMNGQKGRFVYKHESFDALYYTANQAYKFVQLANNNMSVQLIFRSGDLTKEQISEKFGNTVAELFSDDSATLDRALDERLAFIQNNTNK